MLDTDSASETPDHCGTHVSRCMRVRVLRVELQLESLNDDVERLDLNNLFDFLAPQPFPVPPYRRPDERS